MVIQIINHNSGIIIGGNNYPKNSLVFGIENSNYIKISTAGGNNILFIAPFSSFRDESGNVYNSIVSVIEDLGRSTGGDSTLSNKMIVDEASTLVTYIGYADPGSSEADPKWMIQKISNTDIAPPNITTFEWSVARGDKTSIWNNRASLTYVS